MFKIFMKNATKHAEDLRSLSRKLVREHKPGDKPAIEPLWALVRGAMSYDMPNARVDDAIRAIEKEFVDLNELRVATDLEVQGLLGVKYPAIEKRVAMITQSLNEIFEREHTMSLDRLKTISRRDARHFLRELPGIHPFVEAYVMLMSFDGHAMPIDDMMLSFLREEEIVDETVTLEDAQKFLEHHLKAEECYPFFASLRAASGEGTRKKKARV
jgi:endonuclease III